MSRLSAGLLAVVLGLSVSASGANAQGTAPVPIWNEGSGQGWYEVKLSNLNGAFLSFGRNDGAGGEEKANFEFSFPGIEAHAAKDKTLTFIIDGVGTNYYFGKETFVTLGEARADSWYCPFVRSLRAGRSLRIVSRAVGVDQSFSLAGAAQKLKDMECRISLCNCTVGAAAPARQQVTPNVAQLPARQAPRQPQVVTQPQRPPQQTVRPVAPNVGGVPARQAPRLPQATAQPPRQVLPQQTVRPVAPNVGGVTARQAPRLPQATVQPPGQALPQQTVRPVAPNVGGVPARQAPRLPQATAQPPRQALPQQTVRPVAPNVAALPPRQVPRAPQAQRVPQQQAPTATPAPPQVPAQPTTTAGLPLPPPPPVPATRPDSEFFVPLGRWPEGIASDGGNLWVAESGQRTISRVDLQGRRAGRVVKVGRLPVSMVSNGNTIYALAQTDNIIWRQLGNRGRRFAKLNGCAEDMVGGDYDGRHFLFVLNQPVCNQGQKKIEWLDTKSGQRFDTDPIAGSPMHLAKFQDFIWVAGLQGRISRVALEYGGVETIHQSGEIFTDIAALDLGEVVGIYAVGRQPGENSPVTIYNFHPFSKKLDGKRTFNNETSMIITTGASYVVGVGGSGTIYVIDPITMDVIRKVQTNMGVGDKHDVLAIETELFVTIGTEGKTREGLYAVSGWTP